MFKIASWNVNSLKVRFEQVKDWLSTHQVDVLALQETKCENVKFPLEAITALNYSVLFNGQKSYNGVATLSLAESCQVFSDSMLYEHEQKRFMANVYQDILIINVYIPNGQAVDSDKYHYKLSWLAMLQEFIKLAQQTYEKIIILGDFNIAPKTIDHTSANYIHDEIMRSPVEQAIFQQIIDAGFVDSFRLFNQEAKQYSWWDYRIKAFDKNLGYRIDHILVSTALVPFCLNCEIDKTPRALTQPSDHAPILLTLDLSL
jgi:exodeoxyribonuclease-3